ncbi:PilZ domain-containing protein [Sphingomonas glaciei]|uniref:PilZ domain-containing protein n=1 Tax=Sphingomonas glaciei TaxID=2938948 RepID=A0ABY5MZX5_9SPHN|nr:PilZ domain-containing protein [Sphingomonas glaciei]UUR08613.1 PilZ domain-containing protein [Sphingomonas glaciei]
MFHSLIRRQLRRPAEADAAAFDSTTVSLSLAVPRPPERRTDNRLLPTLRVAKLDSPVGEQLIRIRNMSAGGLMADCTRCPPVGTEVKVEFNNQKIPASVVWIREGLIGLKFDQSLDLGELLAGRKPRHGFRPRPPRLEVGCSATVKIGKLYYKVDVHDMSLGGMKVGPIDDYCIGAKVVVVVESLRPIKGEVRWYSDRRAGIVFERELSFEELAEWVGKRLELASLKASYRP